MPKRVKGRVDPEGYFDWLKGDVEYFDERGIHSFLFKRLHEREFYPVIDRDENMAELGILLRQEYFRDMNGSDLVFDGPCTFLEFLVATARKMSFIASDVDEDLRSYFFWDMLRNIGLRPFDNMHYFDLGGDNAVDQALDKVLERTYDRNGVGGLFPLARPKQNQRNVEIWYQLNQYIIEKTANGPIVEEPIEG